MKYIRATKFLMYLRHKLFVKTEDGPSSKNTEHDLKIYETNTLANFPS